MSHSVPLSFERFLNVRAAGNVSFHPQGDRLIFLTDITGVPQVWSIATPSNPSPNKGGGPDTDLSADAFDSPFLHREGSSGVRSKGGWPDQLTFEAERINFAKYSPTDGRLVYGMDSGGNELQQLFLLSEDGSQVRQLTDRPDAMHYWGSWSRDGRQVAFASNRRDPRYFDAYLYNLDTDEVRLVYQAEATTYVGPIAPDGRHLVLLRLNRSMDDDLLLLNLTTGETRHLTPHQGMASYESMTWAHDSQSLYLATDQDRDMAALVQLNITTGQQTVLAAPDWSVEGVSLAPNGRLLAYTVNVDGWSELHILDLTTQQPVALPAGLPQSVIGVLPICRDPMGGSSLAWAPDSRRLAVCLSSGTRPSDVWLIELGAEGREGSVRQLTHSSLAGIPQSELVEPEVIRHPSFDGRQIPGLYYRPRRNPHPSTPYVPPHAGGGGENLPVVVYVHGGPEGQSRPAFNNVIAYFVHRGYAVLAPNVRGSTGYGRMYGHLDDVEKRMDSVADIKHAVAWLTTEGGADPRRIAVMGGSYGGFMVLASVTEYPDLWAAGVDIVGIGNFVTFLERTGAYRRRHRESEYGSLEHHRAVLERISPIHKVDRITAPLMVIHGANDPRVPIFEAEQMVATLKARQHPVEYLRFEDEGHGIVKLANKLVAYPAIGDFLDRFL